MIKNDLNSEYGRINIAKELLAYSSGASKLTLDKMLEMRSVLGKFTELEEITKEIHSSEKLVKELKDDYKRHQLKNSEFITANTQEYYADYIVISKEELNYRIKLLAQFKEQKLPIYMQKNILAANLLKDLKDVDIIKNTTDYICSAKVIENEDKFLGYSINLEFPRYKLPKEVAEVFLNEMKIKMLGVLSGFNINKSPSQKTIDLIKTNILTYIKFRKSYRLENVLTYSKVNVYNKALSKLYHTTRTDVISELRMQLRYVRLIHLINARFKLKAAQGDKSNITQSFLYSYRDEINILNNVDFTNITPNTIQNVIKEEEKKVYKAKCEKEKLLSKIKISSKLRINGDGLTDNEITHTLLKKYPSVNFLLAACDDLNKFTPLEWQDIVNFNIRRTEKNTITKIGFRVSNPSATLKKQDRIRVLKDLDVAYENDLSASIPTINYYMNNHKFPENDLYEEIISEVKRLYPDFEKDFGYLDRNLIKKLALSVNFEPSAKSLVSHFKYLITENIHNLFNELEISSQPKWKLLNQIENKLKIALPYIKQAYNNVVGYTSRTEVFLAESYIVAALKYYYMANAPKYVDKPKIVQVYDCLYSNFPLENFEGKRREITESYFNTYSSLFFFTSDTELKSIDNKREAEDALLEVLYPGITEKINDLSISREELEKWKRSFADITITQEYMHALLNRLNLIDFSTFIDKKMRKVLNEEIQQSNKQQQQQQQQQQQLLHNQTSGSQLVELLEKQLKENTKTSILKDTLEGSRKKERNNIIQSPVTPLVASPKFNITVQTLTQFYKRTDTNFIIYDVSTMNETMKRFVEI